MAVSGASGKGARARAGRGLAWVLALAGGWAGTAWAGCERPVSLDELAPRWELRLDNDLFSGTGQDRGYTNGFMLARVSDEWSAFGPPECLPEVTRWMAPVVRALEPEGVAQRNLVMQLAQALFTPADPRAKTPVAGDRPYAAVLLGGVGYQGRAGDVLHVTQFHAGWAGPAAMGQAAQRVVHHLIGSTEFQGWDHQLRNEPVLLFTHERLRRHEAGTLLGRRSDVIAHVGGSLGNLLTEFNAGVEWRWGAQLPDDFGSHPMRPAGNNRAPAAVAAVAPDGAWHSHLFASLDGNWVLHDLSLDGNTWRHGPSVHRRPLTAEAGLGVSLTRARWKLTYVRYLRTREFDGQAQRPALGSLTVGYRFE